MKNLWNDDAAEKLVADYAKKGVGRDLALRVYTTRLLDHAAATTEKAS